MASPLHSTEMPSRFSTLLGDLVDLVGFRVRVTVEPDGMLATGVLRGVKVFEQRGREYAVLQVADNVKLAICERGLMSSAWVGDDHEPEKETYAVVSAWGNRRTLIVLEPGQP